MDDEVRTKLCSNCQQEISENIFQMHELRCRQYMVLCSVCKEPVPKTELEKHLEEEHTPKPCDLCGRAFPPDQLENHKMNDCPKFQVECKYCDLEFLRADLSEHMEGCGSRTDYCELCNRRVMLRDMEEHKENKCAVAMGDDIVDETIDITSYGGSQNQRSGPFFAQQLLFGAHGFPFRPPTSPPPFPFPFGHAHQVPPAATFEAPPPVRKQPREEEREESFQVDPQWLASVADVCGEENLDQVLAQNMMIQGSYSAAASRPDDDRHGHAQGSSHRHGSTESSGTHESDEDLARQLQEELNRQQQFNSNDESYVRPKTPEFIKTLNTYSYGAGDPVRGTDDGDDDVVIRGRNGSSSSEEDTKQKDAEMARRIWERDLAYAQRNQGAGGDDMDQLGASGGGGGSHSPIAGPSATEDSDAEMARKIWERDLAYAQRNKGAMGDSMDQLGGGGGGEPHILNAGPSASKDSDAEMARKIYERDLAYAQRNQGTSGDDMDQLGGGPHAAASATEDSDAEMARKLYERDLAYARRNQGINPESVDQLGSDVDPHGFSAATASTEDSDARLARSIYERDAAYARRNLEDVERETSGGAMVPLHATRGTSSSHSKGYHQGNVYSSTSDIQEQRPNGVSNGYDSASGSNDAMIAQALQETDIQRVERINADKELAFKLQAQEQAPRHGSIYEPRSPTYFPRQAEDGWDQDMINLENHHDDPGGWKVGVVDRDESLPKTPPTPKADRGEVIPCQYCKKLCSFEGLWKHEEQCSQQTRESDSRPPEGYRGSFSGAERQHGPSHSSSAPLAKRDERVTFPSSVRSKDAHRPQPSSVRSKDAHRPLPSSTMLKEVEVERRSVNRQEESSFRNGLEEKKLLKGFDVSQRGKEKVFSKPESDDSVYLTDDLLKSISNHSNVGYSHTPTSSMGTRGAGRQAETGYFAKEGGGNMGHGYSKGAGSKVELGFSAGEGSKVESGYSAGGGSKVGSGYSAGGGSKVGSGYSAGGGSKVRSGYSAGGGSKVGSGYSAGGGSKVRSGYSAGGGSKVGSGYSVGASDSVRSGSGASLLSHHEEEEEEEEERGPCVICGQLFPIRRLVKHEAICLIRAQSKRRTAAKSEASLSKITSAPKMTTKHRTHSPDRVSNGFAKPSTKPAATKQNFGSASSRNSSSFTETYKPAHNEGMTRTGGKRTDLRTGSASKQGNSLSSSRTEVSSSRQPQLGVEGVQIKGPPSHHHPQYGRGEKRNLDPPQFYNPTQLNDKLRNEGIYRYSDHPRPIKHASNRDRKL